MKTIRLSDVGILPGTDVTLALDVLFAENPTDTTFLFARGDYYFSPEAGLRADYRLSNSDMIPERVLGIRLQGMRNCILEGNGARLLCAGQMQPITLDRCEGVTVRGFTIDWPKPLVAEGEVVAVGEGCVDLAIDPIAFPHRFADGWLSFDVGAGEWYPLGRGSQIRFDAATRAVARGSGDDFRIVALADLGGSVYRARYNDRFSPDVRVGQRIVLRHNARIHAGIFAEKCRDLTFADLTVHSCGGLGCLAQFCHNLIFDAVHFLPNRAAGRYIANGRDDGMHLTCNSGTVTVTGCSFLGLMDDPINIHGCSVTADEVIDARTLRCRFRHAQAKGFHYWAEAGDEIAFIERQSMAPVGRAVAASYALETLDTFTLTFAEPLDEAVLALARAGERLALDNLTHTAAFVCTRNRFGSCRARGVLISTPKPVLIADNYFASSGTAILVAGDANGWFESGACHDVTITRNVFTEACLSSPYQFCDGVIDIAPVVPAPDAKTPFHTNIRIEDNVFDTPATPVLHALSCGALTFRRNRIFASPSADRWHRGEHRIKLAHCADVTLSGNDWIGPHPLAPLSATACINVKEE